MKIIKKEILNNVLKVKDIIQKIEKLESVDIQEINIEIINNGFLILQKGNLIGFIGIDESRIEEIIDAKRIELNNLRITSEIIEKIINQYAFELVKEHVDKQINGN